MTLTPAEAIALILLVALTLYALFGGADYGAGVLDLLARGPRADAQRDVIAHAIGPVWEANHVWLILVVVLLFTAFPPAFSAIMTTLHVPMSAMLVGIVLRGSAFTFRAYDNTELGKRRWNRWFSFPSLATPVLLGTVVGAIATGKVADRPAHLGDLFRVWVAPFPVAVGFFTLAIFTFLAAVYLTLETDDRDLKEDFRRRALVAAVAVGAMAWVVYLLARRDAPLVFHGLAEAGPGRAVRIATGFVAVLAILALLSRYYQLARLAAGLQVVLILWGCALAQRPYLVPPRWSISNAAAPDVTLKVLLLALLTGSVVLIPSILYLFRIFKRHTIEGTGELSTRPKS